MPAPEAPVVNGLNGIYWDEPVPCETALEHEESLFNQAAPGHPVLFLWRGQPALVIPRSADKGVSAITCTRTGNAWPVKSRRSGGGAVPMTPEVINMGLIFHTPKASADISHVYQRMGNLLIGFLSRFDIKSALGFTENSYCDGRYNVNISNRKIIGTSQKWSSPKGDLCKILFHATINVAASTDTLCRIANLYFTQADIPNVVLPEKHTTLLEEAAPRHRADISSMDWVAHQLLAHFQENFSV